MNHSTITNEMIYEYLKQLRDEMRQFKDDFIEFKKETRDRFEQADRNLNEFKRDTQRRFEQVDKRFDEVKEEIRADKNKLQEVYESRDRVTVKFTRSWMTASFFIALIAVLMVLAVEKGLA
jgi:nitrogen fixation/metabolism regulation signal transduction histidine kinase